MADVATKVNAIWKELRTQFFERDAEATGLMVAALSRQHVLLIAPPGTAKSAMVRALANSVEGARRFEKLLTRFTVPEEVFGAVKLSALKKDKFERNVEGHLPEAHFAFLDEVFRANSAILNALLSAINERIFHNNGAPTPIPLEFVLGATNSLPEEGGELAALFDRFLLRYTPGYISEDSNFAAMLTAPEPALKTKVTLDELHQAQKDAAAIEIPADVLQVLVQVRKGLGREGIIASDRRYKQALGAVRAHAFLYGRTQASSDDIEILTAALWDEPTQKQRVNKAVLEVSNPIQQQADAEWDAVLSVINEMAKEKDDKARTDKATEALAKLKKSKNKLEGFRKALKDAGRDLARVDGYIQQTSDRLKGILQDELGL